MNFNKMIITYFQRIMFILYKPNCHYLFNVKHFFNSKKYSTSTLLKTNYKNSLCHKHMCNISFNYYSSTFFCCSLNSFCSKFTCFKPAPIKMNTSIHTITIKINIFNVSLPSIVKDVSQMPCKPTADKKNIKKAFIKYIFEFKAMLFFRNNYCSTNNR